jgi:hypothetical protein
VGSLGRESRRVCSRDVWGPNVTPRFTFAPRMISANERGLALGVQGAKPLEIQGKREKPRGMALGWWC